MGILKLLIGAALAVALAAYVTKPGREDVDDALRRALFEKLFTTNIDEGRDMLGNAAIIGCRLDPQSCFELLRSGLEVTYEDKILYARVTVEGFGRRAVCTGAFTRFNCPDGFEKVPQG
jgi:hypothetical protein